MAESRYPCPHSTKLGAQMQASVDKGLEEQFDEPISSLPINAAVRERFVSILESYGIVLTGQLAMCMVRTGMLTTTWNFGREIHEFDQELIDEAKRVLGEVGLRLEMLVERDRLRWSPEAAHREQIAAGCGP